MTSRPSVDPAAQTWRCLCCGALYVAPPPARARLPHVCTTLRDPATGLRRYRVGARDETLVQDRIGARPHLTDPGLGRILVAHGDALTAADAAQLAALQAAPAIGPSPFPDPPIDWPADPPMPADNG